MQLLAVNKNETENLCIQETLDDEYQQKLDNNRVQSEEKTAKKRAKRMKKKKNAKNKAKMPKIDQSSEKSESDDEDEDADEEDESGTITKVEQNENEAKNEVAETSPTTDIIPSEADGDIEKPSETIEVGNISGPSSDKGALQNGE